MVVWLSVAVAVSIVALTGMMIKLAVMRKSLKEIAQGVERVLATDTNTVISVTSRDGTVCALATKLNDKLSELTEKRRKYERGDNELKTAITNVAHDLRTPLTALCGYLDLICDCELSETVRRYVDTVANRADKLKSLTDELFSYSASSTAPQSVSPVCVNDVLEECIVGYYAVFSERGIVPDIDMTDKRVMRTLDGELLSRVFSNLLSNAAKYSDGDLRISLSADGEVAFSNTAKRLNAVAAGKLFDRFYTVDEARRSTGLGLSIAKTLTERMGGKITADYTNDVLSICVRFDALAENR